MLLLCIGPDTFRAQQKARELEDAFKQKYDLNGSSVQRVSAGKDGVDEIIQQANTISLFSPRRFLRATDLINDCPKAKQAMLAQALSQDPENVIVVSVESEMPNATVMKPFLNVPKIIKYEFGEQSDAEFERWLTDVAERLGIMDQNVIHRLAQECEGDSWLAWNECLKLAAGGQSEQRAPSTKANIYGLAEAYLAERPEWRAGMLSSDLSPALVNTFLSQTRSALRVRDNAVDGLHPYVVKKMRNNKLLSPEQAMAHTLQALFMQRAGFADEEEATNLL